ncbi:MAG: hypothetical protein H7Z73_12375 [Candidatus Saccharibacteria bacterium]|nr:hypothetical protein [Moraxellaceae bacterium]
MIKPNFPAFDAANQTDTILFLLDKLENSAHCSKNNELQVHFDNIKINLERIKSNACWHFASSLKAQS